MLDKYENIWGSDYYYFVDYFGTSLYVMLNSNHWKNENFEAEKYAEAELE